MELPTGVPQHPRDVDHLTSFHGLPVLDFPEASSGLPLPDDPASVAWCVRVGTREEDEDAGAYWNRFLETMPLEEVRALLIGSPWYDFDSSAHRQIEDLVELRHRFTGLEALFLADVHFEECEISWLEQGDVAPLLEAYPRLRELGIRGSNELEFPVVRHEGLRTLRFESGGLPASVVRNVAASDLPSLECLELWLGEPHYGCDTTVEDLGPLLTGERLPSLRHLGLQNSRFQDEIAAAVAQAPVVARLESLKLSMGVLSDEGAAALLGGQPLSHLRYLDLHHHYLSDAMMLRLRDALEPAGVRVDLSDRCEEDEDEDDMRYVAVSE
ncbi:STM4015 family protein [Streptomyces sp. CB02400]|uniref:STM4015 family protein n=1 Tax=Streptomyces sp. CB02400 TaxID=1703944 RepID=UPI00093D991C|nr:cytoplasmic protein [Streptomyces sp. CB02400]